MTYYKEINNPSKTKLSRLNRLITWAAQISVKYNPDVQIMAIFREWFYGF